ncbi:MAG: electron transport complex subunit RsxC [Calditrichia bacterium]
MSKHTFKGGIHPPEGKEFTEKKQIEVLPTPSTVYIPLQQHIGAPTEPLVQKAQVVKVGEKISDSDSFVSVPAHASISGKVKGVVDIYHPVSGKGKAIQIDHDGEDNWLETIQPDESYSELPPKDLIKRIREAGLAGLGGATFPTHVKLSPPPDKKIDVVMLNGAECEPYLTADHRLMLESPREIVMGLQIIMKILDVKRGIIGIEDNKPDAIKTMRQAVSGESAIQVMVFPVKYPQGAEKQMIKAALNREVPSGGLPMNVGVVVQNVGTAQTVYQAVAQQKPLIHRIVTVTGPGIKEPKNVLVPIGTPFQNVVDYCGGISEKASKIIMGGPMMGLAQPNLEVPVVKGTSGILVLEEESTHLPAEEPCIRCGRCVEICPAHLLPTTLQLLVNNERLLEAESLNIMDCIECGSCSYICPSNRYLLHSIRFGKRKIMAIHRKAG